MFRKPHPDQIAFEWSKDAAVERMIEARVAIRAEVEAIRWRFRLICMETVTMGVLVAAAGIALDQPTARVIHAAIGVSLACLASGLLLIALSAGCGLLVTRYRRWRAR
ncbi:hypothetical protein QLH51_13025 [Sphingomonas sp. 2R-10]|uniref:hypothetical protein n=1 Tax=Sphingomonas sp. 2R-10 TaxID=3045148 RepID=UPI000F787DCB|nr:hypothetical protein [Sphingomonas sp. 2R-10]MDJ0277721.1 hypothetical protein [Sphingomonas sp. 2R-10]